MHKPRKAGNSPCKEMMPATIVDLTPDGEELQCEKEDGHEGEHKSTTIFGHIILWIVIKATVIGRSDYLLWRRIRPPKNSPVTTTGIIT
jgi:hypothetical protein